MPVATITTNRGNHRVGRFSEETAFKRSLAWLADKQTPGCLSYGDNRIAINTAKVTMQSMGDSEGSHCLVAWTGDIMKSRPTGCQAVNSLPSSVPIQQELHADQFYPQLAVPQHDPLEETQEGKVED